MAGLWATWNVGDESYKLKLSTSAIVELENKYKQSNLINPILKAESGELPGLGYMLDILHGAMQKYNHGYTRTEVVDLYDEWVESGEGNQTQLLTLVVEIFKVSGFFTPPAKKSKLKVVKTPDKTEQ